MKTNRDDMVIGFDDQTIDARIRVFIDPGRTDERVKAELGLADNAQWTVLEGRRNCRTSYSAMHYKDLAYRPFDQRRIYYHSSVVFNPRPAVMRPLMTTGNLALLTNRRIRTGSHAHFFVVSHICMAELLSSADNCNVYPLWIVEDGLLGHHGRRPSLAPSFLNSLALALALPQEGEHGLPAGMTPEDIFHYAYAVFHSPSYRSRYEDFLKIDFPRLPLPQDLDLFRALASTGGKLVALHLLESTGLEHFAVEYIGDCATEIEKVAWSSGTVWIDKARTAGFKGVSEEVWRFEIGSYQVCEKWLKDRKGRRLLPGDIQHYRRIVSAITDTIRTMSEIDEVIETHGGWPGAFATKASAP